MDKQLLSRLFTYGVGILLVGLVIKTLAAKSRTIRSGNLPNQARIYHYRRKDFIMTRAENRFFDTLNDALNNDYFVFPQVNLSSILDEKIERQTWRSARNAINRKSVDFVICDKGYRRPLLAIELDDWSHDNEDRKLRDAGVERMLGEAGLPLLRFRNVANLSEADVARMVQDALFPSKP